MPGDRMFDAPVPLELADDTRDLHFVPAPCQVACPIGTDAPSYIGHIWEGDLQGALEAISSTNPFSSICGRVCDAPCEPACRRADSDGPIAIRNLKRFVMDRLGPEFYLPPVPVSKDKSIAIVGGGPAGLTAAHDLSEAGYPVHIYEMSDRLGGMMIWGIPSFRLPQAIIQEDIDRILKHCPGIRVHLNHQLGKDITLDELQGRHEAVILAIGAWWGKKLNIPGESDPRVVDGVSFLRRVNEGERPEIPASVVVLGGGDVAMDACRVAKRLPGCKDVKVVYRRGPKEIPARKDELEGAVKESVEFVYNTQPVAFVPGTDGIEIQCLRTELGTPDPDGRRRPLTIAGSEHDIGCGLVIAAVGQHTKCAELENLGLMANGHIATDAITTSTAVGKVFATGDGAFGPSTLVNAMYLGHRTAYYVKAHLEGRVDPVPYATPYRTRRVPVSQDPRWELLARVNQPFHGLGKSPVDFPEIESTYTPDQAKEEAARCYRCDVENGSNDYSVRNREDIFLMTRTDRAPSPTRESILQRRLGNEEDPFPAERPPTLDDIHILPANLSRLVIDPYREECRMLTTIGSRLELANPFIVAGFDNVPEEVRSGLVAALRTNGIAYLGTKSPGANIPWLQLMSPSDASPSWQAAGIVGDQTSFALGLDRCSDEQLLGMRIDTRELDSAFEIALEKECDFLLVDATSALIDSPWPELCAQLDLTTLRKTIAHLRACNKEGLIDIIYFGGIRSGTDAAKVLALGAEAVVFGAAVAFAMMGEAATENGFQFSQAASTGEYSSRSAKFLQACADEASMMARSSGKTNIHSLEPEDLKSITIATARATGVPLVGTQATPT